MSENLSRRGILQMGSCAPIAAGLLSMVSPAVAGSSEVAASWDSFTAIRNEGQRRYKIWCEACDQASDKSPDLPEGLAFPNPALRPWLQFDRAGMTWAVRKGKSGELRCFHYRPEYLADFLVDPPEIQSILDEERVPRVLKLVRDLLPVAESYTATIKDAWREADEIEAAFRFDDQWDKQHEAAEALMDAPVVDASDFIFKARLILTRLDDEAGVEDDEARKLADQMIAFWSGPLTG